MTIPFSPRTGSLGASSSRKRACKYGPRDEEGYCPKKPKSARSARGKPPCKYGPRDAQGYCPKKPKSARSITSGNSPQAYAARAVIQTGGRIGGQVAAGAVEVALNPKARSYVKELAGISVGLIPKMTKVARRSIVGTLISAGLGSYLVTKYIIDKRAATKEQRAVLASKAAREYLDSRIELAKIQGAPLDAQQLRQLGGQFQDYLKSLGLSTKDLRKL